MKVFVTDQPCVGGNINLTLPKVVKQNWAHELFMNMYIVSQQYYYIDFLYTLLKLKVLPQKFFMFSLPHLLLLRGRVDPDSKPGEVMYPWRHVSQAMLLEGGRVTLKPGDNLGEKFQSEVRLVPGQLLAD